MHSQDTTTDTVEIPLTNGMTAIVDAADAERVLAHTWCGYKGHNTWYVCMSSGPEKTKDWTTLHRWLLDAPPDVDVDHANGDGLDNRRGNLRHCTMSQNKANERRRSDNTSGYKGVWPNERGGWRAAVSWHGKRYHLGTFLSAEDAAHAYDTKARELFGAFARTNFEPEQAPLPDVIEGRRLRLPEPIFLDRLCAMCGVSFRCYAHEVEHGRRFCSLACKRLAMRDDPMLCLDRTCLHCGTSFRTTAAHIKKGHGKYCSRACHYAARRTH